MSNGYVEGNKPSINSPIRGGNVERNKFTPSLLGFGCLIIGLIYLPTGIFSIIGSLNAPEVTPDTPFVYAGEINSLMLTTAVGLANLIIGLSSLFARIKKQVIQLSLTAGALLVLGLILSITIPDTRINFDDWAKQRYGLESIEVRKVPNPDSKVIYDENKLATIHYENNEYLLYDAENKEELPLKK